MIPDSCSTRGRESAVSPAKSSAVKSTSALLKNSRSHVSDAYSLGSGIASNLRRMPPPTERLNPVFNHIPMLKPLRRNSATEVDNTIIHQASQANCSGLLGPRKNVLMRSQPIHLIFRNHTCREAFQEQFTEGHWSFVTKLLHHVARDRPPRVQPQISRTSTLANSRDIFLSFLQQSAVSCRSIFLSSSKPSRSSE